MAGAAWAAAAAVLAPELPVLTLADLGVLRSVEEYDERVVVTITPTYLGCPALAEIRTDLHASIVAAGYAEVEIRTELAPPWSTDDITEEGRSKLAAAGIAPPGPAVAVPLGTPSLVACPQCGSMRTRETSRFGPTACISLWRCDACSEPFEHVKEF
jgi:ring-1,2-phenylacetyl-CoA epoxidase subunit PaaD